MKNKLHNALEAIRGFKIPEIPHEVILLEAEIKAKFCDSQSIATIIERNTTLSGRVIKLINSPIMKLQLKTPVISIRDSVQLLGLDNLYNLVVVSALKDLFPLKGLHEEIMNNSLDVAYCMAEISDHVHGISRDEAYMLGLFHNSGALMLASVNEKKYSKLFYSSQSLPLSVLQKEEVVFDTNHAIVGVLVTKKWRLPIDMINAVMLHHTQSCESIKKDQVRLMVAMLKISNSIVSEILLGSYRGGEMDLYEKDGIDELMLKQEDIKDIRAGLMSYTLK